MAGLRLKGFIAYTGNWFEITESWERGGDASGGEATGKEESLATAKHFLVPNAARVNRGRLCCLDVLLYSCLYMFSIASTSVCCRKD